jgi:hypothetical protein
MTVRRLMRECKNNVGALLITDSEFSLFFFSCSGNIMHTVYVGQLSCCSIQVRHVARAALLHHDM